MSKVKSLKSSFVLVRRVWTSSLSNWLFWNRRIGISLTRPKLKKVRVKGDNYKGRCLFVGIINYVPRKIAQQSRIV